jgi:glutamate synthase domain-containing protein 3
VEPGDRPKWEAVLRGLVETHARETHSRYAALMLHKWENILRASGSWCRANTRR